jgi:hypothetical protein
MRSCFDPLTRAQRATLARVTRQLEHYLDDATTPTVVVFGLVCELAGALAPAATRPPDVEPLRGVPRAARRPH